MINARKLMAILLLVAMLCSLMPAAAFADDLNNEPDMQSESVGEQENNNDSVPVDDTDDEDGKGPDEDGKDSEDKADDEKADVHKEDEPKPSVVTVTNSFDGNDDYVAYIKYINKNEYFTSLSDAIGYAEINDRIVLINDCTVDSPITIEDKTVYISSDEGKNYNVFFCNTDNTKNSGKYGRGIIVQGNSYLFMSNLTLVGHSQDGSTYNYSSIIYATYSGGTGNVELNNVTVTGCRTTSSGALGTYYSSTDKQGSITLNSCRIINNSSSGENGGAAIFNNGALFLNDGTEIKNNCSKSEKSGAIYCGDSSTVTISGKVTVSDNLKNCSKGSSGTVYPDGDASDIYIPSAGIITCKQNISGSIGIDSSIESDDAFANQLIATATGIAPFFSNNDASLVARYQKNSAEIKWQVLSSFTPGDYVQSGQSYTYPAASLNCASDSLAVSVTVDSGSFSISALPEDANGYAVSNGQLRFFCSAAEFPEGTISAATISSGWTSPTAQNFIRNISFTPRAYGVAQKVSFGFSNDVPAGSYLFGDKLYRYADTEVTRDSAYSAASLADEQLICVSDATVNCFISGLTGDKGCWTGGALLSDQWYFPDGTRFGASALSSQGYENAFTAWAADEPAAGGFFMYAKSGSWYADTEGSIFAYMTQKDALCGYVASTTLSNPALKTRLDSYSLALEGGIEVNYYFTFAPSFSNDTGARVEITVGDQTPESFPLSELIKDSNKAPHNAQAYGVTVPVEPKNMNAFTLIKFYRGNGTLYGSYGGEGKTNYNVRSYALTVIEKQNTGDAYNSGFSSDLVALVKGMLNYGAAAESQFGTAGSSSTNEGYADTSELTSGKISGAYFTHTNSGISYTLSLYAESDTLMRITPSVTGFSAMVDGSAADCSQDHIDIPVSMQDLGHVYSLDFSGSFDDDLQINVLMVIQKILGSQNNDAAKLTADRLYKMGLAADKYFGSYVPATSAVQAILNTAYAYLAKAEYTQYDQSSLTTNDFVGHPNNRRQLHVSPEEATESSSIYMDCSSFVYNVYREVFGVDAVQAALNLYEKDKDINTKAMIYGTNSNTEALLTEEIRVYTASCDEMNFEEFRAALQPGDLIVKYRQKNASLGISAHGHVVLWTGTGYIHCTGASYDYDTGTDKIDADGAVCYVPCKKFNESFTDGFDDITVLRPLLKLGDSTLQPAGTARQQLGGISVSKTASVNGKLIYPGIGVNKGDVITYTITVENLNLSGALNIPRTVSITDTLPAGLTLSSGSLSCSNVNVGVGETKTLSYTATVNAEAGTVIPATTGTLQSSVAGFSAGKISFKGIRISVEAPSTVAVSSIVAAANQDIGEYVGDVAAAVYSALNTLYSEALDVEDALPGQPDDWVDGLFVPYSVSSENTVYYVSPTDSYWYDKLVSNFASGRKVWNFSTGDGAFDYDTRVRNLSCENLMPGDLLCVYVPSLDEVFRYYIYVDNGQMISYIPGKYCRYVTTDDILSNLLNKTCFAVFRFAGRVS